MHADTDTTPPCPVCSCLCCAPPGLPCPARLFVWLQEAIELDAANPLAHYERATVLAAMERVPEVRRGWGAGV